MPRKPKAKTPEEQPVTPTSETEPTPKLKASVSVPVQPVEPPKPMVVKGETKARGKMPMWLWILVLALVAVGGVIIVGLKLFGASSSSTNTSSTNTTTNSATETLAPRVLDGVPVPEGEVNSATYAVVIENMVDSRPPSGLDKAGVVYETLAEGGITRFLALFSSAGKSLPEIGPVRSARPYFVSWAQEYANPLFVHAGGSPEALALLKLKTTKVVDFNQFSHGGNFIRDDNRPAPHNLYTNFNLLYAGMRRTELRDAVPSLTSWNYKNEAALDARPQTVADLVINFSSNSYKVSYTYDRGLNQYQRFVGDKAHVTRAGDQIYAKNIAVLTTKIAVTQNNKGRMDITTVGTGKLLLFRDGSVTEGTWKKDSDTSRTQFLDSSGQALSLNPGQTWIEVVAPTTKVTY